MTALAGRREHRPRTPPEAEVALVRLAPDGRRLAYARYDGEAAGIYADDPNVQTGPIRLVVAEGWRAEEIHWSPDGRHVAYVAAAGAPPGGLRAVGWARSSDRGEVGRLEGTAVAWSTRSTGLIVADPARKAVLAQALDPGEAPAPIARLDDDGDPQFPVHLAPSPDGKRIAFTCRRAAESVAEVWIVAQQEAGTTAASLLTQVPGAALHVLPFWSPRGVTLGMLMVHHEYGKSGIVALPRLEGEGEILYENELLDRAVAPAWSASSRAIAFFHTPAPKHELAKSGPSRLVLLDCETRELGPLSEPDEVSGTPWFLDERSLVVDGGPSAHVFTFAQPP